MKKNQGFTLLELLGVIIILAAIALITIPNMNRVVDSGKKNAFRESVNGIIRAADSYYANLRSSGQRLTTTKVFDFSKDVSELKLTGEKPEKGILKLYKNGATALAIIDSKENWCALKNANQKGPRITTDLENCNINVGENLFVNGFLELGNNDHFSKFTYDDATLSFVSANTNARADYMGDAYIAVDSDLKYQQSISVQANNTTSKHYIGFQEYDNDKKNIEPYHYSYVPNTRTKLARELKDGDTEVYFEDLSNWNNASTTPTEELGIIFWNYADSSGKKYEPGTYSRNIWRDLFLYSSIDKANNKITLKTAWNHGLFPKGTVVNQSGTGPRNWSIANKETFTTSFQALSGTPIQGVNLTGIANTTNFSVATKYIRFSTIVNYNGVANTKVYLKDISFKPID